MRTRVVALEWIAVGVLFAACRQQPAPSTAEAPAARAVQPAPVALVAATNTPPPSAADPARLPEDPEAGKASEQQWREHLVHEEDERQMIFDSKRLREHHAVVKLFTAARARFDGAASDAAVSKAQAEMPRRIAELKRRITQIDHWGVNSRLLSNYQALETTLTGAYPDARRAALHGDAHALDEVRAGFDRHLTTIDAWLERCEKGEEEEED